MTVNAINGIYNYTVDPPVALDDSVAILNDVYVKYYIMATFDYLLGHPYRQLELHASGQRLV